jgi:hypothetical protein
MSLEINRAEDGGYNISGMYYSKEEASRIKFFIETEEMNDEMTQADVNHMAAYDEINNSHT